MSNKTTVKPLLGAISAALLASAVTMPVQASENPFSAQELSAGFEVAAHHEEGKCGEGKCGGDKGKKDGEGKCGEGKCGGAEKEGKKDGEGKCGEGKCGEGKKEGEGKCGEGKCGG